MANFGPKTQKKGQVVPTGNSPVRGTFQVVEPRCKVCTFAQRREIDMMLALGWSQAAVINHWNNYLGEDYFKRDGMSIHTRKHLSVKDAGVVAILEERARQEGMDVELQKGFILTKTATAESIIMAGLEAMHRGDTIVEPKDILKAIEVLKQLTEDRAAVAEEEMLKEARAFMVAVKRNVPKELWDQIFEDYEIELGRKPLPLSPVSIEEGETTNDDN